jgi:hypothetical protein
MPAKIRRMSKRRQKTALFRYVKRGIACTLHQGYRGFIVTDEMKARMVEEINSQLLPLYPPTEYITINFVVTPTAGELHEQTNSR